MPSRADFETFRQLPWQPNTAMVNSNLFVDDEPWPACSRTNLIRMTDLFAKEGYILNGGFEPEHFLVVKNPDGSITGWDPQGIDMLAVDYLQDIMKYSAEVGMYIYQCDHEDANW